MTDEEKKVRSRERSRAYAAAWYAANKERSNAWSRAWHAANKEHVRKRRRNYEKLRSKERLIKGARHRAKKKGVLGTELIYGAEMTHRQNSASIDQIAPGLGYVPGNVEVVSMRANTIKNNATPEELVKVARYYAWR